MKPKRLLSVLAALLVSVITSASLSLNVNALIINTNTPKILFDSFDSLTYSSDPLKPWWATLGSSFPPNRVENVPCTGGVNGDSDCLFVTSEGGTNFLRMRLRPGKNFGDFSFSQLTEERDAMTYGQPHKWLPTPNHPVILNARFRLSSNFNIDGSGGAQGTIGIGLWNNPIELLSQAPYITFHDAKGIQFSWQDSDAFGGQLAGLQASIYDAPVFPVTLPKYHQAIRNPNIDLSKWNVETIIWSVDNAGHQNVKYIFNLTKVAEFDLENPLPAQFAVLWNDNNNAQFTPTAPKLITQEQYHDVDYFTVTQL